MRMKVILLSCFLFGLALADLTCECGKRNAGRIVGGKETKKNEYPWMVAFQTVKSSFTFCGGTILTPWHIVTAAHCTGPHQIGDLVLVVGAHNVNDLRDPNSVIHGVKQIAYHESADLALIETLVEIQFNEFVGPACMPDRELTTARLIGETVKAMGWGRYNPSTPNRDRIKNLREVDLGIVDPTRCNKGNRVSFICAWANGKDTCNGDSGGPLLWLDPETNRFTLVGIVSFGPGNCGSSPDASNNVNVVEYRGWIKNKISSLTSAHAEVEACENDIIY